MARPWPGALLSHWPHAKAEVLHLEVMLPALSLCALENNHKHERITCAGPVTSQVCSDLVMSKVPYSVSVLIFLAGVKTCVPTFTIHFNHLLDFYTRLHTLSRQDSISQSLANMYSFIHSIKWIKVRKAGI
jgi:hypothetical protein